MVDRRVLAACLLAAPLISACSLLWPHPYEYEEQLYLYVDGRATVVIDASLRSLAALRGMAVPDVSSGDENGAWRRLFEAAHCRVDSVSGPRERRDRLFIRVQVSAVDLRSLSACGPLGWSSYALDPLAPDGLRFLQSIGAPIPGARRTSGWDGSEIVAFRVHLPSRIREHNFQRLDGSSARQERGNILTWEQRLSDRLASVPIVLRVEMDAESILNRTLWLFAGAFAAAVAVLAMLVWWTKRRGRRAPWATGPSV